jgi:ABC-type transport system substrate-binding protein
LDSNPPAESIERFTTDPDLRRRLVVHPTTAIVYLMMNLAIKPFDDLHVRKAVSLVIDKAALIRIGGGTATGSPVSHLVPDDLLERALVNFDPYRSPQYRGDIEAAQAEMARSTYDGDGDGLCDDVSCDHVIALTANDPVSAERALSIAADLAEIGIELDVRELAFGALIAKMTAPAEMVPVVVGAGWSPDYPNASTFLQPLFHSDSISDSFSTNTSLLGADPQQLHDWGYRVAAVPTIDDEIDGCLALHDDAQTACWAEVDRLLMEDVVPFVPLRLDNAVRMVSNRVTSYSFDQATAFPAVDRIGLRTE